MQPGELRHREVRRADADAGQLGRVGRRQLGTGFAEHRRGDGHDLLRGLAVERSVAAGGFGRDADGVEHGHATAGRGRRAEGLAVVLGGRRQQAVDHRHPRPGHGADHVPDQREHDVLGQHCTGQAADVEQDAPAAGLVSVQAGVGHPAGQRGADVDEVAVALGPGTQHRVGEDDRVGLRPRDLFTELGAVVELVRGTRPRRSAAHRDVGVHECGGRRTLLPCQPDPVGVAQVERTDVQRRRHAHLPTRIGEGLREVQAGASVVEAAVDVGARDGQQPLGPDHPRQCHDHPHGRGDRLARATVEEPLLLVGQREDHGGQACRRMRAGFSHSSAT